MVGLIHTITAILLILAHGIFLFRALMMRKRGGRPAKADRIARTMSHWLYPAVLATGVIIIAGGDRIAAGDGSAGLAIHIVIGFLPMAGILVFTPLLPLKRKIPWLLPTLNLLWFLLAGLTGFLAAGALQ